MKTLNYTERFIIVWINLCDLDLQENGLLVLSLFLKLSQYSKLLNYKINLLTTCSFIQIYMFVHSKQSFYCLKPIFRIKCLLRNKRAEEIRVGETGDGWLWFVVLNFWGKVHYCLCFVMTILNSKVLCYDNFEHVYGTYIF